MNDEFLHRIRKTPPPEFLAGLKARLDRQSPPPVPRRRWSFTRGLITGLLLGGVAFALTAVSLTRGPESLRSLFRTPAEYFARLMSGGNGSGEGDGPREARGRSQHNVVPLGPVWLPDHTAGPSGQPPRVATQSTGFAVKQDSHSGSVNSAAPATGSASTGSAVVGGFPGFETIRVVASSDTYALGLTSVKDVSRLGQHLIVERDANDAWDRLCISDSPAPVEAAFLARRMTAEEFRRCTRGGTRLVEIKVGYQAIALARARLYGPLRLTARDLFLALARHIPDPTHLGKLINNPNTTWNQVDGALPYDRIQVAGPDPGSASGKLVAHLLLQSGCNGYQWIAALGDSDPDKYEEICGSLREDGAYARGVSSGWSWSFSDMLTTNPTAVGIFSQSEFSLGELHLAADSLLLNPVNSIEPGQAGLTAGTYPLAETLYLYVNKSRVFRNQAYVTVVQAISAPKNLYGNEPAAWAFVPLESAERKTVLANAAALKELQF
jgi:phosphate transport system substrate-binding protein